MGEKKRNRLGGLSLALAVFGFLLVELQPWLQLGLIRILGSLTLKGLLEAFFEASMAGGFADWFAVSALFRDPFGFPLPHTDILAKNKDKIAAAVPNFLTGFVSSEALARELRGLDYASMAAEILASEGLRTEIDGFLVRKASEFAAAYGNGEGAKALGRIVGSLLDFLAERVDAPSLVSALLFWARKERLDHRVLETLAGYAADEIGRNRSRLVAILMPLVKRNAGWQGFFIGSGTVERFLAGVQDELRDVRADKANPLRLFALGAVSDYAVQLERAGSVQRERLEAGFKDALAREGFRQGFARFASGLLARLGKEGSGGSLAGAIRGAEDALLARLSSDGELRGRLNSIVASLLVEVVERGNVVEGVSSYLAGLLRATDERVFVARIEESVSDDLQYIRVNGAVVGGLVGLAIALARAALGA